MLIEIKAKVTRLVDNKPKKKVETYLIDTDFFAHAEYNVSLRLSEAEEYSIQSMKLSTIKEIANQTSGENTFIATLKDIFHDDEGNEKYLRYKVLLWANDLTHANSTVHELAREGYDMQIEGIKQVDYKYLVPEEE